ncbi:MAG: outer membrane protein assembly factor BamB, partial [Arenimonas sp.]
MLRRVLILALVVAIAPGCGTVSKVKGWFGSDKASAKLNEPAALTEIIPAVTVTRLWSTGLGKGEGRRWLRLRPTIDGNRVYAVDDHGVVRAFDSATGKVVWEAIAVDVKTEREMKSLWMRKSAEAGLTSSPGVGNGLVVVGGRNGEVVAFDASSGTQRWKIKVTSEVLGAPLVLADKVIVRANDGRVFGLGIADGSRKWVFDRGLPTLSLRGNSPPVAGNGLVYIGYDDGSVIALRESDGLRAWEQRVAEPDGRTELDRVADIDGELQVGAEEVFAASFHRQIMAMASSNGRPLWNRDIGSANGLALVGDKLITSDTEGNVWALERSTGNAVWKQEALVRRQLTTPVVQGEYVVVGDLEGYLHWLRLSSGEIVGRTRLENAALRGTPQ